MSFPAGNNMGNCILFYDMSRFLTRIYGKNMKNDDKKASGTGI